MNNLKKANDFIAAAKKSVDFKYRPDFHMCPPVGWMNDPNGLIYFGGKYHLFYQFNPYSTATGTMYWGHFVSDDLITYSDAPVAIAPEEEGASIFSGGAVEYCGKLCALYTRHFELDGVKREDIYGVISSDGINFSPLGCLFDNESLPKNLSRTDFRDPCPVTVNGKLYVLVGGKDTKLNRGVIVVLCGTLEKLEYKFTIGPFYELGDMGECPSYCKIDGKDVLIASGCNVKERGNNFKNVNSSVFIVGNIDFENGKTDVEYIKEIDKGDTFYAPQFISGAETSTMVGWLEMWGKRYPTHELNHGWCGAFSIPREIYFNGNDVCQRPVSSIKKYLEKQFTPRILPEQSLFDVIFNGEGRVTVEGENGSFSIGNNGYVYLDTVNANNLNGCVRRTCNRYGNCAVRVIVDVSGVEIFIDGGVEAISGRVYIDGRFRITAEGGASIANVNKIGRKK